MSLARICGWLFRDVCVPDANGTETNASRASKQKLAWQVLALRCLYFGLGFRVIPGSELAEKRTVQDLTLRPVTDLYIPKEQLTQKPSRTLCKGAGRAKWFL